MNAMENKRKHLEMIQAIISRMASNLFYLKGWAITLVVALFALETKDANSAYVIIALFSIIIFWVLDGYFLSQERLYRSLYDDVRIKDEAQIDFSMNPSQFIIIKRNQWWPAMWAPTLVWFYVSLIAMMILVMFLIG